VAASARDHVAGVADLHLTQAHSGGCLPIRPLWTPPSSGRRPRAPFARSFIYKGAFGQVGNDDNIPTTYNGIVTGAVETLAEGATNLEEASYAIYRIAEAYEENVQMDIWLARGGTIGSWHRHGRNQKDDK
jgi:hypothetical protein